MSNDTDFGQQTAIDASEIGRTLRGHSHEATLQLAEYRCHTLLDHDFFDIPPDTQQMRFIVSIIAPVKGIWQQRYRKIVVGKTAVHFIDL